MNRTAAPRTGRRLVLLVGTALAGLLGALVVPALPAAAAAGSYVRLAHLSPDTPAVDAYLTPYAHPDQQVVLRGVSYGDISPYQAISPGSYTVSMRAAGAPADSPAVISTTLRVTAHSAHTVAGLGHYAHLGLKVLTDDLSRPRSGHSLVRVIQASARVPTLTITAVGGPEIASNVEFGSATGYRDVTSREWRLRFGSATNSTVKLADQAVYSVVVLDGSDGRLRIVTVTDARGSKVVPAAAVPAGLGGSATHPGTPSWLWGGIVGAAALLAAAGALLVRSRRRPYGPRHATTG